MVLDPFSLLLSIVLFSIYSVVCIISVIFTFFPETYLRIDERLKIELIPARILTPLEQNIDWLDAWLIDNNKIVGPLLILLALIDIKFSFDIIYHLQMI